MHVSLCICVCARWVCGNASMQCAGRAPPLRSCHMHALQAVCRTIVTDVLMWPCATLRSAMYSLT
jgi:hypothetical protein